MNKQLLKKLKKMKLRDIFTYYLPRLRYPHYYKKLPIQEKTILLEASHGVSMNGNIYYLLRTLALDPQYQDYKLYLACRQYNQEQYRKKLDEEGMQRVETVIVNTRQYIKLLASAKYLMNDTTFYPMFVKRPEQVYLNTWHGTPLKTLGKKVNNDLHNIGNVQKNFFMADYLLYPNVYTMEHMVEDYMLPDVCNSRILLAGYPRNTAFFDDARAVQIRTELELTDKKVYAFMPTWRGAVGEVDPRATTYLQYYLFEIDKRLCEDEVMYVSIHPLARKDVKFRAFKHILPFPTQYETYEFLNAVDCLVTDYSSVFYDFAVTRKKCVLFTYDEEEYFADRGLYRPLSSLPFPSVKTVDELFAELRSPKNYDDTAFLKEYCPYDRADAAKALCDRVILGKSSEAMEEREVPHNGLPNVLLYVGNLSQNGITTSILNLMENVDHSRYNYFITFRTAAVKPNKEVLAHLPDGVRYIAMTGKLNLGFFKKAAWILFADRKFHAKPLMWLMKKDLPLEVRRNFGDAPFDTVVQFNGYEAERILLFSAFDANRVIYVHSDMYMEIHTRKSQRKDVLRYAYDHYDRVALVTEDLIGPTNSILPKPRAYELSHNLIAIDRIRERGRGTLAFDPATRCNKTFDEVKAIAESSVKKLVNVGRYSREKGHERLINAFNRVWQDEPDTYLFIIGGNQWGNLYDELCEYVNTLPCADHVVLILSMSNPLPLVKACDGFILSSFYEGFGLVLVEADLLGLPVVSTDIVGPRGFMNKHGGVLVEDSDAGVEDGLRRLLKGEVPKLTVDYEEYNRTAVAEFTALLRKDG